MSADRKWCAISEIEFKAGEYTFTTTRAAEIVNCDPITVRRLCSAHKIGLQVLGGGGRTFTVLDRPAVVSLSKVLKDGRGRPRKDEK